MAKLIINRPTEFILSMLPYKIFIDGELVGHIQNSETKEIAIVPGKHCISFKVKWFTSQVCNFNIKEGDIKKIKVHARNRVMKFINVVGIVYALLLCIQLFSSFRSAFTNYLGFILLITVIYTLTIGKNSFLVLTPIEE